MQVWVNTDDMKNVGALATALEKAMQAHSDKELKAFVVFVNSNADSPAVMTKNLEKLAADKKLDRVALTYLSGPKDEAVTDYAINTDPKVKNTVFVYRHKQVDTKFINLVAEPKGLKDLDTAIGNVVK